MPATPLPFTVEQFHANLADYNLAVWPAPVLLSVLAAAMVGFLLLRPAHSGRWVALGLCLLWAWSGLAYQFAFFRTINPVAPGFALLWLAAAVAFAWSAFADRLHFGRAPRARRWLAAAFVAYALLLYPLLGAAAGQRFPATPSFGLPCPTTLLTVGILLLATREFPRVLALGPLLWATIGSFAALWLRIPQDAALVPAAFACAYLLLRRRPASRGAGALAP
jgi:hypothetical protein